MVPGAQASVDSRQPRLATSITKQIAMRRDVACYVDAARWGRGINAAFVSYQASIQQNSGHRRDSINNQGLYINSGLNLGHWRLRSNHSLHLDEHGKRYWSRAYAYAYAYGIRLEGSSRSQPIEPLRGCSA